MQEPHDDLPFSVSLLEFSRMLCLFLSSLVAQNQVLCLPTTNSYIRILKVAASLPVLYGKEETIHYFFLIQGLPGNGLLKWINPYKYRNPTITSITVLFRLNQVMFNNVDSTNVIRNTNGRGGDNTSLLLHAR